MTRQEKINAIGKLRPSTYLDTGVKNQMSYFIIPVAHEVYKKRNPEDIIKSFASLNWTVINNEGQNPETLFPTDKRTIESVKSYLYDYMIPSMEDGKKNIREFFSEKKTILLRKNDLETQWNFENFEHGKIVYKATFELEGIDLWILDDCIAFFTVRTKLSVDDESTLTDISAKFNRSMRDFRSLYMNQGTKTFSNDASTGMEVLQWLYSLLEIDGQSLLSQTEEKAQDLIKVEAYQPVFNTSYHAKMITAIHIDEMEIDGEEIESSYTDDLMTMLIDGTSTIEEIPYHLASTSALYPTKMWENNEEYINSQVGNGEINIWKYWSGVALHDSLAFFSIGEGGSGIVNSSRNSYYFIYMLNLYVNYKLRYFEHRLIDSEFTSIENIRPMFTELQKLKNQFMCTEISSLFQPNIVHAAVNNAMKTDDIYEEIKGNVEVTLELTAKNTDIMITAVFSIFSIMGMWLSQDMLTSFFAEHPYLAGTLSVGLFIIVSIGIVKRSVVIKKSKKWRKKIVILITQLFN